MKDLVTRDVEYWHDGVRMLGYLCAPAYATPSPAILLIHDAFGVSERMIGIAHDLAREGRPVFVADVWGDRFQPASGAETGPLIKGMAADRGRWIARIAAAHEAMTSRPEYAGRPLCLLGYCFGGTSALEYLRSGAHVAGIVSLHGGLDLLGDDWSRAGSASVLICTGAEDPMAPAQRLASVQSALTDAGVDWQVHLYGHTRHAFTDPAAASDVAAYSPRSAARAAQATSQFLDFLTRSSSTS
ncbi:dienelactone hydrolase family protein [Hamadaea sp. NPDC051192]|uniref:dienelactone hydrolase family protein n=1 Tax=Hamadaea sp. NPDC051192 TaxID=3154940 RepID=UPI003446C85D